MKNTMMGMRAPSVIAAAVLSTCSRPGDSFMGSLFVRFDHISMMGQ
jgi:hypothetical protein